MKIWKLTLIALFALVHAGCSDNGLFGLAKDRPEVKIPDPNQERWAKSTFTNKIWLSKATVVKTSGNGGFVFTGFQSDTKAGYFRFTKDELRYENANALYVDDPSVDGELLNSWSIDHSEYRLSEVDGRPTNRQEENPYLSWDQKRYFKVNWERANISEGASFPYSVDIALRQECWMKKSSQMVDGSQEISEDYISFTIAVDYQQDTSCYNAIPLRRGVRGDVTFTAHYKYSFMKMPESDYEPWVYQEGEFDPLMKKYGFFQTVLEKKGNVFPQRNVILMDRWHPKKTHAFYFTKDFPEKYKWMLNDPKRGIFPKTNALFKKHGLNNYNPENNTCTEGLCFEIRENSGQEFGDIRYSFVNFVDEADPAAPLGYGPHDANPFTGEIVAANLLIWTGYLDYYTKRLEQQLPLEEKDGAGEIEKYKNSTLFKQMKRTLELDIPENTSTKDAWLSTALKLKGHDQAYTTYLEMLPDFTYGYPYWSRFTASGLGSQLFPNSSSGRLIDRQNYDAKLMDLTSLEASTELFKNRNPASGKMLNDVMWGAKQHLYFHSQKNQHTRDTTLYPVDNHLADVRELLLGGKNAKDVIDTIVYRVSIHEFGHNLSLRHNFYGSVDEHNFRDPIKVTVKDEEGNPVEKLVPQSTSSVMEYLDLKDEIHLEEEWEPYDEAALVYAYSNGKIDLSKVNNTNYLYCTDEHRVLNILCNTWDKGSTPSEIAMSIIEGYEGLYEVSNKRFDRPYWDTRRYSSRIFGYMWDIKKFVALYETSMRDDLVRSYLSNKSELSPNSVEEINNLLQKDLKRVIRLSVAFYDAVLQQSSAEKHYRDLFDDWSGAIKRIGIAPDKIFAMTFLMGDSPFMYNPNRFSSYSSYVSMIEDTELPASTILDKVMENLFTSRVDMEDWFAGFGRALYTGNAYSFRNMDDWRLLDKIRVACYKPESFEKKFGSVAASLKTADSNGHALPYGLVDLDSSVTEPYFNGLGGKVGVLQIDGNYYVSHELYNRYSYKIIETMINNDVRFERSLEMARYDVMEAHMLYWYSKEGKVPECR